MNQKKFIIRKQKRPLNSQFAARRLADSLDDEQQRSNDKQGCIWMLVGFLLGPIGLIIAAIFGRVKGAIAALVGLAIWAVLWLSGIISLVIKHI